MKFRFRVTLLTVVLFLVGLTALVMGLTFFFAAREAGRSLAGEIVQRTSALVDQQFIDVIDTAADQGRLSRELIEDGAARFDDFPRLASYWVRVMKLHPELANIYITLEEGGDTILVMRRPPREHEEPEDRGLILQDLRRDPRTGELRLKNYATGGYPNKPPLFEPPTADNLDQRDWPWYKEARAAKQGDYLWSDTYVFFNEFGVLDLPGVTFSTPVHVGGRFRGVVGVDFDFYELCNFLDRLDVGEHGMAFVVETRRDGTLRVIAHEAPEVLLRDAPDGKGKEYVEVRAIADGRVRAFLDRMSDHVAREGHADLGELTFSEGGQNYFGGYCRLGHSLKGHPDDVHPDWLICTLLPEEDVIGPARAALVTAAWVCAGALLAAVLLSLVFSRQVARPLEQLAREAEEIGRLRLDPHPPFASVVLEVDRLASATEDMKTSLRSFRKYVPADLVRRLLRSNEEARLGGERRAVTVFFSDIVDFTAASERLTPEDLVEHLRQYLTAMSGVILDNGGTVDKYIGDAVMAFWGAPEANPRHAVSACAAALRCQAQLKEMRPKWKEEGRAPFFTRMGLNTGEVVVGNVGSEMRLNYTVIGDAVNLASRLEGLNKHYGTEVLISETTYQEAKAEVVARPIDWVSVKGKTTAVLVYELLGLKGEAGGADEQLAEAFGEALASYRRQEWAEAVRRFERAFTFRPDDLPAQRMIARCLAYQAEPPGPNWDGVHRLDTK